MVYGNFDGEAVSEDRQCNPMGIYGALKYGSEKLVIGYNQVLIFHIPSFVLQLSMVSVV